MSYCCMARFRDEMMKKGREGKKERKEKAENQPACAGDLKRLRTRRLFTSGSRQETRSSGAIDAPLKQIRIVILFQYPTSLVMALTGGLTITIQIVFVNDVLSIDNSILRPAKALTQAVEKLNRQRANASLYCIGYSLSLYCVLLPQDCAINFTR